MDFAESNYSHISQGISKLFTGYFLSLYTDFSSVSLHCFNSVG